MSRAASQTATPRLPPEFDVATHSGQVIITHSNRPFGCRHPRSLSFDADCWWFARVAKLMVKLLHLLTATYRATARGGELDSGEGDM